MFETDDPAAIFGPTYFLSLVVGLITAGFNYAVTLQIALADLRGQGGSLREAARRALPKILPVLGLVILWVLGVMIGWILLVVPGLILLTMWSVALPAVVAEPIGPIKAFGRSRALTKGNRWRIFLLLFVVLLLLMGFQIAITQLMAPMLEGAASTAAVIPGVVALASLGLAWGVFTMVLLASLYDQLRRLKEGARGETMAEVFG